MKKIVMAFLMVCFMTTMSFAFLYNVEILDKEKIKKLQKEELLDKYTEALIERHASEAFHGKSGFTPKEYNAFKELLGYIVKLRQEMLDREMDPPPVAEWLKQ